MTQSFKKLGLPAFILLALPFQSLAQFDTATVLVSVKDATGAVVVGSKVTLENIKTGVATPARTNDAGTFDYINVQIGTYRVKAEAPGFKTSITSEFSVAVNARQRVELKLEVGDITQSVAVQDAAALLEADSSERGQVITAATLVVDGGNTALLEYPPE